MTVKPKKIVQVISLTISVGGLVTRIVRWFKVRRRRRHIERMLKEAKKT
jgi:hypothetical protein